MSLGRRFVVKYKGPVYFYIQDTKPTNDLWIDGDIGVCGYFSKLAPTKMRRRLTFPGRFKLFPFLLQWTQNVLRIEFTVM